MQCTPADNVSIEVAEAAPTEPADDVSVEVAEAAPAEPAAEPVAAAQEASVVATVAESAPVDVAAEDPEAGYAFPTWTLAFPFVGTGNLSEGSDMSAGWLNRMFRSTARAETSHPEWGGAPIVDYDWPEDELRSTVFGVSYDKKLAEQELMHGRWAMLGVSGMIAAENTTGVPWFEAGGECDWDVTTPCSLSYGGYALDLEPWSAWGLLGIQLVLMTGVEAHRAGWPNFGEAPPSAFEDVRSNDMYPGGRFDPFDVSLGNDNYLELMQVREVKHGRLAMLAFAGMLAQAYETGAGPMANLAAHRAAPYEDNINKYSALRVAARQAANAADAVGDVAANAADAVGDVAADVASAAI